MPGDAGFPRLGREQGDPAAFVPARRQGVDGFNPALIGKAERVLVRGVGALAL